jgi:hypothetical protein
MSVDLPDSEPCESVEGSGKLAECGSTTRERQRATHDMFVGGPGPVDKRSWPRPREPGRVAANTRLSKQVSVRAYERCPEPLPGLVASRGYAFARHPGMDSSAADLAASLK